MLQAVLYIDDNGGFTAMLTDGQSVLHETKRYASRVNARQALMVWVEDNLPGHRVTWTDRKVSSY